MKNTRTQVEIIYRRDKKPPTVVILEKTDRLGATLEERAVHKARVRRIVHRDLKPENVIQDHEQTSARGRRETSGE
jgi:serine/threonine protein kinase